uniref:dual specificity protein kinase CLK1-like isoform X2 n=1 Tax=Doryrhamphus excisus TaxID=161450 RepID=UPI0025AE41EC|nr:dual specificity protein kinase CLK1-like isoform X2 [Doryrhamphus excisus]
MLRILTSATLWLRFCCSRPSRSTATCRWRASLQRSNLGQGTEASLEHAGRKRSPVLGHDPCRGGSTSPHTSCPISLQLAETFTTTSMVAGNVHVLAFLKDIMFYCTRFGGKVGLPNPESASWAGRRIMVPDSSEAKSQVLTETKTGSTDQCSQHSSTETDNSLPSTCPDGSAFSSDDDEEVRKSQAGQSHDYDEEEGHMVYHIGLVMKERYEVVSTLGAGAFGKVVKCIDRDKGVNVAVKIVRNIKSFSDVAKSEIAVLEEINTLDDDNRFACVRMLEWFEHQGHMCMVFELLGLSTYEVLRQNDFLPYSMEQIRHMAFQIFRAVSFLHRNKLTHTDLKPENILFVCSDYNLEYNDDMKRDERKMRSVDVKVVDFGTATFDHERHEPLVSTRHYRAPEVILDLGWNQSCDVWSLACVLMEYYLGQTLFPTHNSKEHLAMMEKILGPIPPHLLKHTRKQHYVHSERLDFDEQSSSGEYIRKHCKPLKYMVRKSEDERQLFDLLGCMLEYDVGRRITMEEALWHPFFSPMRTQKQKRS